jgi:hypothetical protein
MAEIAIPVDGGQPYRFAGELIAGPVTTAFDHTGTQRPRWLEASLYRRDGHGYVVSQENYSLVWHQPDIPRGHVRIPVLKSSSELDPRAIYCGEIPPKPGRESCPPLANATVMNPFSGASAGALMEVLPPKVITEAPQRKVFVCPDWRSVIAQIATARHGASGQSLSLSAPMRELLALAAENDPAFADALIVTP